MDNLAQHVSRWIVHLRNIMFRKKTTHKKIKNEKRKKSKEKVHCRSHIPYDTMQCLGVQCIEGSNKKPHM